MSVGERDPHTGHMTTGHDWNGIKELNTPVPKPVLYFLAATVIFSLVYWVLMPAWPLGVTYTKGLLGIDQRTTVEARLSEAAQERSSWSEALVEQDFGQIAEDDTLMAIVRHSGSTLFGDNCAVCHGAGGEGGPGYPSLTDGAWLWGGEAEDISETLRVGINAEHPETRIAEMLAFGRDGILDRQSVLDTVSYVQSLSGATEGLDPEAVTRGEEAFAMNCSSCHGESGQGDTTMGAPDLTDGFWIYGGDRNAIYQSVFHGRQGHMPQWETRLSPVERKILTLYVRDLGEQAR